MNKAPGSPSLSDLATLASLLALAPAFLLAHLPPEMHAMGGYLAAGLLAVERLVAVSGDRASLLVCQGLPAACGALVKTAGRVAPETLAGLEPPWQAAAAAGAGAGANGGGSDAGEAWLQRWRGHIDAAEAAGAMPGMWQLLPQHSKLNFAPGNGSSSSNNGGGGGRRSGVGSSVASTGVLLSDVQLSDDDVLLVRMHELLSFAASQEFGQVMAAAQPLRRVLRPSSASAQSSCTKSA